MPLYPVFAKLVHNFTILDRVLNSGEVGSNSKSNIPMWNR
jgi:hypothetical protein